MSTAAELLVKCLENEEVEYIFGIPGEENIAVMDALLDSSIKFVTTCLLYTSPSPRDKRQSRMPSSA